jgi:hypothetical protein
MREQQDSFIKTENLRNFMRRLEMESDPDKRRVLIELIQKEKAAKPTEPAKPQ